LPFTGMKLGLAVFGLAALALGAFFLLASRRRA
jgi:hypothetical protein